MSEKAVCYYRVSTTKQGISGLGLQAQKKIAHDYCKSSGLDVIAEYEEVRSGGKNDREKIREALDYCELTKARLVVAKLDRISRDVGFIDTLLKSGIRFVCADMPEANESMIQFMSVFAQYERKMASERTKAALDRKKALAKEVGGDANLGNPDMEAMRSKIPEDFRARGVKTKQRKARERAEKIMPLIRNAQAEGCISLRQVADWLNKKHIQSTEGKEFRATTVKRILDRTVIDETV